jgi:hypothetical protein
VKNPDVIICLVLAAVLSVFAFDLGNISPMARIYPAVVIAGSYVLIVAVLVQSIVRARKQSARSRSAEPPLTGKSIARISIYCVAILAYITLIDFLGYIASTIVFGLFSLIFMGNKSRTALIVLPAAFAVLMFFIFDKFLYVRLPDGFIVENFFF